MEKDTVELTKNDKKKQLTEEQKKKYRAAQKDFLENTNKSYTLTFGINFDSEIIEALDNCDNINSYIRDLIQEDIKRKSEENK